MLHRLPYFAALAALFAVTGAQAAERFTLTVSHDLASARADETVVVPYAEVQQRLPGAPFGQVIVRDAKGRTLPSQVIAYQHAHKGPQTYDELVFQHDFAAGEKTARFTVEASPTALPPIPSKVYGRFVQERFDDFAWENDRVAHRAYGPGLALPSAGKDQMTSSGIDIWTKKVPYLIVDRWYQKGHDGLHSDTGEGLDFYDVGTARGLGGSGVWDGTKLFPSGNFKTWRVYTNGPLRLVFELSYEPWDANGVKVTETKRFIVDAGQQLDEVQSRFDFTPPAGGDGTLTVALGLTEHPGISQPKLQQDPHQRWLGLWEAFSKPGYGQLGTGIVLAPEATAAGFARLEAKPRPDDLILAKVKPGETLRYFIGGGWDQAKRITDATQWTLYLDDKAKRLAAPLKLTYSEASAANAKKK